jgi:tRNA G46 methylase TrmB
MAMDADTLSSLIQQKLTENGFVLTATDWTKKFCGAIAEAVVEHITSAAEVTTATGSGTIT